MFPGTDITTILPELVEELARRINPLGLDPFAALCLSRRVDHHIFDSAFFQQNKEFILFYEHHTIPEENRLFLTEKESLIEFLRDRIRPERGEGLDVIVTTKTMIQFLICSHDGDMFFRTPSEWPALLREIEKAKDNVSPDDNCEELN